MTEKYEDLHEPIINDETFYMTAFERLGAKIALQWLDEHPDQVPGRTMTESEIAKAFGTEYVAWARLCLARIGITVVPDPEPTNAEKIIELMGKAPASLNRRDLAKWLDEAGVKAPGGDDDH